MERAILKQHLAQAKRHSNRGRQHLARQVELIAELDRDGHDTMEARKVLATLRHTQVLHEQDVQRLLRELER
jgi:hypothetical protein